MTPEFAAQYTLVQGARAVLLDCCAALGNPTLLAPVPAFNNSCLRDLLVHVVNCYQFWLGKVGLQHDWRPAVPAAAPDLAAVRALFAAADGTVTDFGQRHAAAWLLPAPFAVPRQPQPLLLSPLQLFTHVITHEFHHKGQMLGMVRLLGHVPPDTDVIRT